MKAIFVKRPSGVPDALGTGRVISIGKASRRLAALVGVLICATFLPLPAVSAQVTNTSSASLSAVRGLFGAVATAPTGISAVAGDGTVRVSWLAPADAASSGVTNYRVRRFAGDTNKVLALTVIRVTRTSLLFSGLVNLRPYSFDVTAISGTDLGAVSARSDMVGFGLQPVPVRPPGNAFGWALPSVNGLAPQSSSSFANRRSSSLCSTWEMSMSATDATGSNSHFSSS